MSDRYFFGGRVSSFASDLFKLPDVRRLSVASFRTLPIRGAGRARRKYTPRLHFMEHWCGVQNGGIGGVGRRVFDVSCNGVMLLRGFDICREEGTAPLVKPFSHIEPTPQGKIEIYFTPAVNYPSARLRQFQSRECPDILREKPMSSEKEKRGQEPGTKRGHFYRALARDKE